MIQKIGSEDPISLQRKFPQKKPKHGTELILKTLIQTNFLDIKGK